MLFIRSSLASLLVAILFTLLFIKDGVKSNQIQLLGNGLLILFFGFFYTYSWFKGKILGPTGFVYAVSSPFAFKINQFFFGTVLHILFITLFFYV
jgi:hypothetical protein|tara:strand:+ start:416 stop:700 length:285 start_codon:yes stop_codon:yes gene_type:complete